MRKPATNPRTERNINDLVALYRHVAKKGLEDGQRGILKEIKEVEGVNND